MAELQGIEYLRKKLEQKRRRVLLRYKYYEMKNHARDLDISSPEYLKYWMPVLGWCAKSVDTLSDRLVFKEFKIDDFNLNELYNLNNPDTLFDSAVLGALIGSCSFIYIVDDPAYPKMEVIDGSEATGVIERETGFLTEGYAVLERDRNGIAIVEAYFTPGNTRVIRKEGRGVIVTDYPNIAPYPLLVPIIYRPDAKRPFGHSRISRSCMDLTETAMRTLKRSEISAEFYSYPQKYVTGMAQDAEPLDKWKASMSSMLMFTKDEDGDKPTIGQFQQQSMAPHTEMMKTIASLFAAETGMTVDDLGFVSDNPSSAEAIKASHENLRLVASKAQRTFGTGFLNAGYLARCLADNYEYRRNQLYKTVPTWYPIFTPDSSMLSLIGDGAIKINQAVPGYFTKETLEDLTGIAAAEDTTTSNSEILEVTDNG